MIVSTEYEVTEHKRLSKLGNEYCYRRKRSILVLRCDNCSELFKREKGSMDPKRTNNNFYHVCPNCDPKKFAQSKGVEKRKIWDLPASSTIPVSKY